MDKWIDKVAVITGASSGIGEAIVKEFAKSGITVVGLARRSEKIVEIAKGLGEVSGKVYARKCDVSDLESMDEAFKWIEEQFGSISILVNNAAITLKGKCLDEGSDATDKLNSVIDTNFKGLVHCTRAAVRLIKKADNYGFVININSVLGHEIPFRLEPRMNLYTPTKYAVTAFTEILRQELLAQGNEKIRVSSVSPGSVITEIMMAGNYSETKEECFKGSPYLEPEDVAQTVSFLLRTPFTVNITEITVRPVGERN